MKYNYCLDQNVQNLKHFESKITISEDEQELIILNRKLHTSLNGNEKYVYRKSAASCKLSEIKGIIYGGISSRFWMLRKHTNYLKKDEFKKNKIPFLSWECITL